MRTIKRYSLPINQGKWEQLREIARLYRAEKNLHLKYGTVQKSLQRGRITFTNLGTDR
jgi:hypothetical protein